MTLTLVAKTLEGTLAANRSSSEMYAPGPGVMADVVLLAFRSLFCEAAKPENCGRLASLKLVDSGA